MSVGRVLSSLAIVAVIILMGGFLGQTRFRAASYFPQPDSAVWYCAGKAVNERADPYLVEPLRSCEIRNDPNYRYPWVEPAPLPGYALAAFALMARLPFPLARILWLYLLIGTVVLTAVVLAKLTRLPTLLTLVCLAMVDGYVNLFYGELPPVVVAALVAAAALGNAKRYTAAAVVAAVTMIEPHIGLPACLSMFVWWPRTRVPFVVTGVFLTAISVAAIGIPANVEYFQTMLPLQAAAEIAAQDQFSLTRVLHILGFSDKVALSAGTASYVLMTLLGISVARRVAAFVGSGALIALLPPAMALLGGPFVHDLQLAAAIPATLMLASSTRLPLLLRAFPLIAIGFPWHHWTIGNLHAQAGLLDIGAVAAAMLIVTNAQTVAVRTAAVLAGAVVIVMIGSAIRAVPQRAVGPPTVVAPAATAPADSSAANWAAFISRDRGSSVPNARDIAEKIPVWLGLFSVACTGVVLARRRHRLDDLPSGTPQPAVIGVCRDTV
ncbi:MAG: hypothetical protein ABSB70_16795 [Candidatus Velthaea sp.]|jgi:hypothetical protein